MKKCRQNRDGVSMRRGRRERCMFALAVSGWFVIMSLSIALFGCCPTTKYRVLSFFFDGVPVPPGMPGYGQPETIVGPGGVELDPNDPRTQAFLATDLARRPGDDEPAPTPEFLHEPYEKRQCARCHPPERSFDLPVPPDSCRKCHQAHYNVKWDDWVHGPTAVGSCSVCHRSHSAQYEGLLRKPVPDLCFSCHNKKRTLAGEHHKQAATQSCSSCHDPHFAGNRLLLVDSGSYKRRRRQLKVLPSKHSEWEKETCKKCHLAEKSNRTVKDVDAVCLSCHEKVQKKMPGQKLHDPIVKGKCVSCHKAHKSPLPKLIKPDAEKNCFTCHKLEEIQKESHPRITRGDCLLCHAGHTSRRKHLLKEFPSVHNEPQSTGSSKVLSPGPKVSQAPEAVEIRGTKR